MQNHRRIRATRLDLQHLFFDAEQLAFRLRFGVVVSPAAAFFRLSLPQLAGRV